jgi:hypothetical protein
MVVAGCNDSSSLQQMEFKVSAACKDAENEFEMCGVCITIYTRFVIILAAKARSVCHMDFAPSCSPPAQRKGVLAGSRAAAALGLVATPRHAVGRKDVSVEICCLRGTCLSCDNHYLSDARTR